MKSSLGNPPRHVAIIMDGNGRWAEQRGLARTAGHRAGADSVREVVRTCRAEGVRYLTLYAFSVANWHRPPQEVGALMVLLAHFAQQERDELIEKGIRLEVVGDVSALPASARQPLEDTMRSTAHGQDMVLSLALSYGGRRDMVLAARTLAERVRLGLMSADQIDETAFAEAMSTHRLPPVDLLIRTGGESRISDFLLYESAYAELLFLPVMWPDFGASEMRAAITHFQGRERRFGLTSAQVAPCPVRKPITPSDEVPKARELSQPSSERAP